MIDLHAHVLPGIDDGPPDLEAAVALTRAAATEGVEAIVATPHVSWGYQNTPATIATALHALTAELAARSIAVRIYPGAEVALTRALELSDGQLRGLALGAGPWLLIEAPIAPGVLPVETMLHSLANRGHRVVLAHVERCPAFIEHGELLGRLVREGMLASITASALLGRFGRIPQQAAERFIAAGLIHNVSSDAHDCTSRPPGVLRLLAKAGLAEQAPWLTQAVPEAILSGAAIPPAPSWPPAAAPRRRLPWSRRAG